MAAGEWYREWFGSPYYHQLYFGHNEREAAAFIQALLRYLKPPAGSRMLDAGCGRGRHSRLLAAEGFDVTGVDPAQAAVQEALSHPIPLQPHGTADNLHFYLHDLRLPFWINYFDYAFSLFTAFGYYATRREHDDAVRTIAAGVKPGGTVLFDYLNVHYVEENLVHHEVKQLADTTFDLHRWHTDTHFFKRITITDPGFKNPLVFTEQLAKFSLGDFTDMLSFQRLQVTDVFGDYKLSPYHVRNTPRMIVVAKK